MSETKTKTIDVTPIFNYTRQTAIVKRFIEQLTRLEALDREDPDRDNFEPLLDYIRDYLPVVRGAVSEMMADDIKAQIQSGEFPLRAPAITFHEFTSDPVDPICINDACFLTRINAVHL